MRYIIGVDTTSEDLHVFCVIQENNDGTKEITALGEARPEDFSKLLEETKKLYPDYIEIKESNGEIYRHSYQAMKFDCKVPRYFFNFQNIIHKMKDEM